MSDKEIGSTTNNQQSIIRRPPYAIELLDKPYPKNYKTPIFVRYDGRKGNVIEHVNKFLDTRGQHAGNEELCLRECSKSLTDRAYTWYTRPSPGSIRTWDEMVDGFCSKFFQEEERMTFVSLCNNNKQNVNEGVVEFSEDSWTQPWIVMTTMRNMSLLRCASTIHSGNTGCISRS